MNWIIENAGNIAIVAVLALIIVLIVVKMIKNKKSGKGDCSCGCSSCGMKDVCHKK
ncbi:MAG: FeoB-associated Cys-rich membrane protein [Clostridia bacterium]|nr:FeoB-associated Cys-rich membrane protein [Clostridia bacterium]MBQ4601740.1 FeoB-associated Cys-rich membrane protein [Clostridia bacterium]